MPLIQPEDNTPLVPVTVRLRSDEAAELRAYAHCIRSKPDYVVAQAIRKLTADKEFRQWLADHPEALQPEMKSKSGRKPKANAKGVSA